MLEKIEEFLKELNEVTGECFVYREEIWVFSNKSTEHRYNLSGNMQGFGVVSKETQQELIDTFPLIREQVSILCNAHKIKKLINSKMIEGVVNDGEI